MVCLGGIRGVAQQKAAPATKPSSAQAGAAKSPAGKKSAAAKPTPGGSPGQSDLFGGNSDNRPKGPTEITASQEAQFDTKARTGVFIGNVKVVDPQFTLTSNRLTVHLNRDEDGGGLSEADAEAALFLALCAFTGRRRSQSRSAREDPQGSTTMMMGTGQELPKRSPDE